MPYRWLNSPRAERLKPDQITGPSSRSEAGVIQAVSAVTKTGSERTVKISFRAAGGSTVEYTYPKSDNYENVEAGVDFIADAASGRIYPIRYFPARIEAWLKGKRATLRTYGEGPRSEEILWLEP